MNEQTRSLEEKLQTLDLNELRNSFSLEFAQLETNDASQFFSQLDKFCNTVLADHPHFQPWFQILEPEKRHIISATLLDQNFSEVDDTSDEYYLLVELLALKNKLRHKIIREYLKKNHNLEEFERITILHHCDIAEVTDMLFIDWRKNLFRTQLGKKIRQMESEDEGTGAKHLLELGLAHPYALYFEHNGQTTQKSLAEMLPTHYAQLEKIYTQLIADLEALSKNDEVQRLLTYFHALKVAHACEDLSSMEKMWANVDIAWVPLKGRVQPVHAMESNYMDPARIRIMPECRILIEDSKFGAVNEESKRTQEALIGDLKELYSDKQSWKKSETAMRNSHIGVYIAAIYSGSDLPFKMVGQSAPCRNDIRIQYGSKISLNMQSMKDRFEKELKYTSAVFGEEKKQEILSKISPEQKIGLQVAAHEVAHAAFVDVDTDRKIGFGILPMLEEAKATWGIFATIHRRVERGELPASIAEALALILIVTNMRYLTIRGETTLRPYYIGALMELNNMINVGLIAKNSEGKFIIDESKFNDFYAGMHTLYDTMVKIYDEYDSSLAKKLLDEQAKETPMINEIFAIVSKVK